MSDNDKTEKHCYEIRLMKRNSDLLIGSRRPLLVGYYAYTSSGEIASIKKAKRYLRQDPDIIQVHVYRSHPSLAPIRQLVGVVRKGDTIIDKS